MLQSHSEQMQDIYYACFVHRYSFLHLTALSAHQVKLRKNNCKQLAAGSLSKALNEELQMDEHVIKSLYLLRDIPGMCAEGTN